MIPLVDCLNSKEEQARAFFRRAFIVHFKRGEGMYSVEYDRHGNINQLYIAKEVTKGDRILREEVTITIAPLHCLISYGNNFSQTNGEPPFIIPHEENNQVALKGVNSVLNQL